VLGTLLGLNVRVRATVGAEPPAGQPGAPGPEGPGRGRGGAARRPETGPDFRADGPARPAHTRENSTHGSRPTAPPTRPQSPAPGAEDSDGRPPEHEASRRARPGPQTASGGLAAKRLADSHPPSSPRSSAFADEEWPDDATGRGDPGGSGGLTGMELIQRQLGGRIIEEIEEG
jgi:DNA polymerase-3 subunit gamma/tau